MFRRWERGVEWSGARRRRPTKKRISSASPQNRDLLQNRRAARSFISPQRRPRRRNDLARTRGRYRRLESRGGVVGGVERVLPSPSSGARSRLRVARARPVFRSAEDLHFRVHPRILARPPRPHIRWAGAPPWARVTLPRARRPRRPPNPLATRSRTSRRTPTPPASRLPTSLPRASSPPSPPPSATRAPVLDADASPAGPSTRATPPLGPFGRLTGAARSIPLVGDLFVTSAAFPAEVFDMRLRRAPSRANGASASTSASTSGFRHRARSFGSLLHDATQGKITLQGVSQRVTDASSVNSTASAPRGGTLPLRVATIQPPRRLPSSSTASSVPSSPSRGPSRRGTCGV